MGAGSGVGYVGRGGWVNVGLKGSSGRPLIPCMVEEAYKQGTTPGLSSTEVARPEVRETGGH